MRPSCLRMDDAELGQTNWPKAVELIMGRGGHPRETLDIAPERVRLYLFRG